MYAVYFSRLSSRCFKEDCYLCPFSKCFHYSDNTYRVVVDECLLNYLKSRDGFFIKIDKIIANPIDK